MPVKFIHTADWQIGKGLNHIPGAEELLPFYLS